MENRESYLQKFLILSIEKNKKLCYYTNMAYKVYLLCTKKGCMELVPCKKDTEKNVVCERCQKKQTKKSKVSGVEGHIQ